MGEIIQYDHVSISYPGVRAVCDLSFLLEEGEILAIVGESGSGKSSLIRAAMGLLTDGGRADEGHIWFQGRDLLSLSDREKRKINGAQIGMVFQNAGASFCPVRRLQDQLYEAACAHGRVSKENVLEQARDLLAKLGLDHVDRILFSYPFELSGGMQQRVAIAAAMLLRPKLLLADEPTSALDAGAGKQLMEELLFIRNTFATSMILVSHDLDLVREMADWVLVMKEGRMVGYGRKNTFYGGSDQGIPGAGTRPAFGPGPCQPGAL